MDTTNKQTKWLDQGRVLLHGALSSERGNGIPPLRWARGAAALVNDLAGRPLCSAEELRLRRERLAEAEVALRERGEKAAPARGEPAPVVLYVSDQDHRNRKRLEEILKGREIPYQVNDVTDDEVTRSWVLTKAQGQELPLLFIAGEPLGDLEAVMQADVRGELARRVFG